MTSANCASEDVMTREEALKKWCPHARQAVAVTTEDQKRTLVTLATSNRNAPGGIKIKGCECIADDCMAWRWDDIDSGYCGAFGGGEP